MTRATTTILGLTRRFLKGLLALNAVLGLGILALLIATFVNPQAVITALTHDSGAAPASLAPMRAIMVIGVLAAPLTYLLLDRLVAMVDTVRAGDPFVSANAVRLGTIAWAWLGLQVLHLGVGAAAASVVARGGPVMLNWNVSLTGWLAVVLLFVLAQVFAEGARMREDLQGMV